MRSVLNCASPPITRVAGPMQMVDGDECCNALTDRQTNGKHELKSTVKASVTLSLHVITRHVIQPCGGQHSSADNRSPPGRSD